MKFKNISDKTNNIVGDHYLTILYYCKTVKTLLHPFNLNERDK